MIISAIHILLENLAQVCNNFVHTLHFDAISPRESLTPAARIAERKKRERKWDLESFHPNANFNNPRVRVASGREVDDSRESGPGQILHCSHFAVS